MVKYSRLNPKSLDNLINYYGTDKAIKMYMADYGKKGDGVSAATHNAILNNEIHDFLRRRIIK